MRDSPEEDGGGTTRLLRRTHHQVEPALKKEENNTRPDEGQRIRTVEAEERATELESELAQSSSS